MCIQETQVTIARLQLQPGDTLVVSTEHRLTKAQYEQACDHIKRVLPAGVKVLLLDDKTTVSVVFAQPPAQPLDRIAWACESDPLLDGMPYEAWVCRRAGVAHAAEAIGFDAWMRIRTDDAHAAYMAGHATGGVSYGASR